LKNYENSILDLDERVYSHNRPTSPCQILNLDNEPKNREIIKNTNESNDQLTITETDFKNEGDVLSVARK